MLRHLLISSLNTLLHNPKPSLRHSYLKHRYHGLPYIIEIRVTPNPITPIIHTSLHINNQTPLFHYNMSHITFIEGSFEVINSKNPKQEKDQKAEEEKVHHIWQ